MNKIKLMPDYNVYPLWVSYSEGPFESIKPEELGLSDSLIETISDWQKSYDETLNLTYPVESGFENELSANTFEVEGVAIWKKLIEEIGNEYDVIYFSDQRNKEYKSIEGYRLDS